MGPNKQQRVNKRYYSVATMAQTAGFTDQQGGSKVKREEAKEGTSQQIPKSSPITYIPKLVSFSGEPGKNEVSYDLWRYDVTCLLEEKVYSKESIRNAVRNSLRGEAARIAMRLGTRATIHDIQKKFEGVYGSVDSGANLLTEFYKAEQKPNEDVSSWSCRLEEFLNKANERTPFPPHVVNEMLRQKFWNGLHKDLRDSSRYKYDQIEDFDRLRIEIRKIERDNFCTTTSTTAHSAQPVAEGNTILKELQSEMKSLRGEMKSLRTDVDKLLQKPPHKTRLNNSGQAFRPPSEQPWKDGCWRCGHKSHKKVDCKAKRDIDGNILN